MNKHSSASQAGFTLVELLVAIAVGAVVTMSLTQVVTSYLHVSQRGRYLYTANSFVEAKVEGLRNQGYNAIPIGTTDITSQLPAKLPPKSTASMIVSAPATGLKQIDITVTYKDNGLTNSYAYTTYMGELGVGQ
jgi:prepilin-type N-terminal cleavage/methylation domain-containing protein